MVKSLKGTFTTPRAAQLLDELRALRNRVEELEHELARARAAVRDREEQRQAPESSPTARERPAQDGTPARSS